MIKFDLVSWIENRVYPDIPANDNYIDGGWWF